VRPRALWLGALAFVVACSPISPPATSGAPVNACSESTCSAYEDAGAPPSCENGACVVPASLSGVIFVVELSADSSFAPERTFVVPYDHLFDGLPSPTSTCAAPTCGHLPGFGVVSGSYVINGCVQSPPGECAKGIGFNLGNASPTLGILPTALPVTATFRMLEDSWHDDVVSLGLPVASVRAESFVNSLGTDPGPQGAQDLAFQTFLEPGTYERTLVPDPPFDAVFGPEVRACEGASTCAAAITVDAVKALFERDLVAGFDATKEEPGLGPTLPTFNIARAERLEGWSAYLRDAKTSQTISNVRPLSGTLASGVLLLTNRPGAPDALTNAELVVAPPAGTPIPTGVFPALGQELPVQETYPPLPQPVTMTGNVVFVDGSSVPADLVFEALSISDQSGRTVSNFEFVGYASARRATSAGASVYSVLLPPGQYRVDVRPIDPTIAVTIADVLVDVSPAVFHRDFTVLTMSTVQGTAVVADERPLSGATVEALPTQCFAPPATADAGVAPAAIAPSSSPSCLPRSGQVTTRPDGSFALDLDPGGYILRVRPVDGSRLPWVTQTLTVGVDPSQQLPPVSFMVPAPAHAGMQLFDPTLQNPIVNGVVRAFARPTQAPSATSPPTPAIELGRAITDTNGRFDLYLALPTP
jgi:hypothetical protein